MSKVFREGELVKAVRCGNFSLYSNPHGPAPHLKDFPAEELNYQQHPSVQNYLKENFKNIEGKVGLIVYVEKNLLDQPTGYRVLIEGHELFCKSTVAIKYFIQVGNDDACRGSS
jgi:hypothetical protein